ncbi:T9SS type A sorting domain-containing protein [Lacinutrix jangbogonensis]|uniref:T9SS type A sorting domain-containing protein n=1 Tax=Lacinutrix jangbogonensis TaxID=1469557 RepID=UPI00053DB92F|nr:T9SS type A sorting domain-containing protein [Lacinutrix jangbogonensis]
MKTLYTLLCCFCVGVTLAQSDIASVEYFIDTDPGIGLATTVDIVPDAETIDQNFSISTSGLSLGTHRLFIRAINFDGNTSMYEHKTFRIAPAVVNNTNDIVEAEYFFNQDPGIGLATIIDLVDAETIDEALTISIASLSVGTHRLFVRVKNSANKWSLYEHKTFRIAPTVVNNTNDIVEAEYFFNQDPGIGLATTIDLVDAEIINEALTVSTSSLPIGTHRLFVRVKNSTNKWSLYEHKTFRVAPPVVTNTSDIVEAEYFFNQDPGIGIATTIDLVDAESINDALTVSTSSLPIGTHRLFVRVKNSTNKWSLYEHKTFRVAPPIEINTANIVAAEYYIDVDPGFGNATTLAISGEILDDNLVIPTSESMAQGDHYLHIRVQNTNGTWSLYESTLFELDGTLGVSSETLSEINIYPNPTSDYINIKTPNTIQIKSIILIDMNGKVVISSQNQIEKINISHLQQGVYLLQIHTDNGSLSKRIIKK